MDHPAKACDGYGSVRKFEQRSFLKAQELVFADGLCLHGGRSPEVALLRHIERDGTIIPKFG